METKALKPTFSLQAPVEDRGAQRAALADEGHVAGTRDGVSEGGVQAAQRIHHAQAVGADEPHLAFDQLGNAALQLFTMFAKLFEAGGDHDAAGDAQLDGFRDEVGHAVGGSGHDHQVRPLRQFADAGVRLDSQDVGALGVDRIHGAAEGAAQQVPQHGTADAAGTLGSSDERYALGHKQRVKRVSFRAINVGRRITFQGACNGFWCGKGSSHESSI